MWEDLGKTLVDVAYAGVGAVVLVAEQAGKLGKVLVERGEEAVDRAGRYSEELHQKVQDDIQRRRDEALDGKISSMDAQQREDLRRRLDELDEIERQAAEMQADAEDSGVTEIHGGPQDQDDDIFQ
ncbi:MAG: hypothetical protein HFF30_05530 [Flavonifractor sp.]|jgi:polyhydroxyalkanoate synthesis regulator phasin|nr:hypothetical protein [Flavonifractor sp.]MCI9425005.1 hypothetical protein [Flavonifractor sp.]MCI9473096.1 hypothetical protein [Flavonifractor sp.]